VRSSLESIDEWRTEQLFFVFVYVHGLQYTTCSTYYLRPWTGTCTWTGQQRLALDTGSGRTTREAAGPAMDLEFEDVFEAKPQHL
jgi:hypothetical protein